MKAAVIVTSIVMLFGCTLKDNDIKQSIAVNAKEDLMFTGISYSIQSGIVTLAGNCPSQEIKNKLMKRCNPLRELRR